MVVVLAVLTGFMVCFSLASCSAQRELGSKTRAQYLDLVAWCVAEVENCFLIERGPVPGHFFTC